MKKTSLLLIAMLLINSLSFVSAQAYERCLAAGMMYGGYGSGIMLFSWLFGILVLVALVLLIVWLIKQIQRK